MTIATPTMTRRSFLALSAGGAAAVVLASVPQRALADTTVDVYTDRSAGRFAGSQMDGGAYAYMTVDGGFALCGDYDKHYPAYGHGTSFVGTVGMSCSSIDTSSPRIDIANVIWYATSGQAINGHAYGDTDRFIIAQNAVWMLVGDISIDTAMFLGSRDHGETLYVMGDPPSPRAWNQQVEDSKRLARWAQSAGDLGHRATHLVPTDGAIQDLWTLSSKGKASVLKSTAPTW